MATKRMSMAQWINARFPPFREPSLVLAPPKPHKLDKEERRERRLRNRARARLRPQVRRKRRHGR